MKLFVLLSLVVASIGAFRYDGYRLLEITPLHDLEKVKELVAITDSDSRNRQVILMNEHVIAGQPIGLAVSPQAFSRVAKYFNTNKINFNIVKNDLQKSFDETMRDNEQAMVQWNQATTFSAPTVYLGHADQIAWLHKAVAQSTIATTFTIGKSYEGRNMTGVKINGDRTDLPSIWIDANIHAREWLTSATTLYIINEILNGQSAEAVELRTNYRWYILPNANPDGYEYSRNVDRLWRKTRSRYNGTECPGADPNRNWDFDFGRVGTSGDPCDPYQTYRGVSAFSEAEPRNIANFVATIARTTNVYIAIHSYSQLLLLPWSAYDNTKPDDYDELLRVGNLAAEAIKSVHGRTFKVGTPPDLLGPASGSSFDYIKAKLNVKYVCAPELRPAGGSLDGFDVAARHIELSGQETFAGVHAFVTNAKHKL